MTQTHPNRRNFVGVLTRIGLPSDQALGGSQGHRVIISHEAAVEALDSLKLTPVGFGNCWSIHNMRQRCGIITEGEIIGNELYVRGHLFARDFPEVITMMEKGRLGMSYETDETVIADKGQEFWTVNKITFCGAAILYADKAAYRTTWISLAAAAALEGDDSIGDEASSTINAVEITLRNVTEG